MDICSSFPRPCGCWVCFGPATWSPLCLITSYSTSGLGTLLVSCRAPAKPPPPAPVALLVWKLQDSRVHGGKTASCPHHDAGHSPSFPLLPQHSPEGGLQVTCSILCPELPSSPCHHLAHRYVCNTSHNKTLWGGQGQEPMPRGGTEETEAQRLREPARRRVRQR